MAAFWASVMPPGTAVPNAPVMGPDGGTVVTCNRTWPSLFGASVLSPNWPLTGRPADQEQKQDIAADAKRPAEHFRSDIFISSCPRKNLTNAIPPVNTKHRRIVPVGFPSRSHQ